MLPIVEYLVCAAVGFAAAGAVFALWIASRKRIAAETIGRAEEHAFRLAKDAERWLIGSLAVMLASGLLLWTSEAVKCYYNLAFWLKMGFLALAITFTFTVRQRVAAADGLVPAIWMRTVAFVSVTLWSGVGLMGRGIGFY